MKLLMVYVNGLEETPLGQDLPSDRLEFDQKRKDLSNVVHKKMIKPGAVVE